MHTDDDIGQVGLQAVMDRSAHHAEQGAHAARGRLSTVCQHADLEQAASLSPQFVQRLRVDAVQRQPHGVVAEQRHRVADVRAFRPPQDAGMLAHGSGYGMDTIRVFVDQPHLRVALVDQAPGRFHLLKAGRAETRRFAAAYCGPTEARRDVDDGLRRF